MVGGEINLWLALLAIWLVVSGNAVAQKRENPATGNVVIEQPSIADKAAMPTKPKAAEVQVYVDFRKALLRAQQDNKDVVVVFTALDWCYWSKKLLREVIDTLKWRQDGLVKYVQVNIDLYPNPTSSAERSANNKKLAKELGVIGYPTVILCDAQGRPYSKTGYISGGTANFLSQIQSFTVRKVQRDALLRSIAQSSGIKKLEYLLLTLRTLNGWGLANSYIDLKEQLVMLAPKYRDQLGEDFVGSFFLMDASGKKQESKEVQKPSLEKLRQAIADIIVGYTMDLVFYYRKIDANKARLYTEIVSQYSPAQGINLRIVINDLPAIWRDYLQDGKWQDGLKALEQVLKKKPQGEVAQQVYYLLSGVEYRLGKKYHAIFHLKQAEKAAPGTALAVRVRKIIATLDPPKKNAKKR